MGPGSDGPGRAGSRRISSVLRVRRLFERRALGALAAGERRVAEAEAALERRREAYRTRPQPSAPLSPLQLRALQLAGIGACAAVEEADAAAGEAGAERDALRAAWSQASVQRKSAQRLEERRHAAAVAAAEAVRSRALEELVTLRHGRRR